MIIYDNDCQVEDGDEVESGVCKTLVGEEPVWMRKRSRFYLSPCVNESNRFGKLRKKDKPRYWWARSFNDDKLTALMTWLNAKDGMRYIQRGTLNMYRSFCHPVIALGGWLSNAVCICLLTKIVALFTLALFFLGFLYCSMSIIVRTIVFIAQLFFFFTISFFCFVMLILLLQHMDEAMYLMRKRIQKFPNLFPQDVVLLDDPWSQLVDAQYKVAISDKKSLKN